MSDSIQDTEEWIKRGEIKRLAQESLDEKWYEMNINNNDWISNCAFCEDAIMRKGDEHQCEICYIGKLLICSFVARDERSKENKAFIIKALEELSETGTLSEEIYKELDKFEPV